MILKLHGKEQEIGQRAFFSSVTAKTAGVSSRFSSLDHFHFVMFCFPPEMKQRRGRPPQTGDSARQDTTVSSPLPSSCSSASSPSKQGGKKSKPELMVIEEGDDIPVEHV